MASRPALRQVGYHEDVLDSVEVPAAVVCARCGKPDCPGCESLDETTLPSGIISIVPWERPGQSTWVKLWLTARATTRSAPQFFQSLPPGDHAPAFLFAVVAELCAVVSWALLLGVLLVLPAPDVALRWLADPHGQMILLRVFLVGTLGFTAVLVVGHAVYGAALDAGARRAGARSHASQALRYGLYAAGWDLLTSPLGFIVALVGEGPRAAAGLVTVSMGLPGRAATAFLRGIYRLEDPGLTHARNHGTAVAVGLSVVGAVAVLVLLVAAVVL